MGHSCSKQKYLGNLIRRERREEGMQHRSPCVQGTCETQCGTIETIDTNLISAFDWVYLKSAMEDGSALTGDAPHWNTAECIISTCMPQFNRIMIQCVEGIV